jgi:low affinity Fe/Cu permease
VRECGKNVPNRHVLVHFCRVIPRRCLQRAVVHRDIAAIYRDIDEYIRRGAERHFQTIDVISGKMISHVRPTMEKRKNLGTKLTTLRRAAVMNGINPTKLGVESA